MVDITSIRVYSGHELAHLHMNPLVAGEEDRTVKVTPDTDSPDSSVILDVQEGTHIKILGLVNDVPYRIYVKHDGDTWADNTKNYKTVCPSEQHIVPARSNSPARDVLSFFTVFHNLISSTYPTVIMAPHGSFTHFGEIDKATRQLSAIDVERLRALEATLQASSLTDAEKTEYEGLKGQITTGNNPVITYRVLARQHASTNKPFSNDMELSPRTFQRLDPESEEYTTDEVWTYDNMIEIQIHSRDLIEADRLCLIIEYVLDDYRDTFERNGVPFVYFDGRESDEFNVEGHVERHVRTVRAYAKTQRVHQQAFPLIREIHTDYSLVPRIVDASILIEERDF